MSRQYVDTLAGEGGWVDSITDPNSYMALLRQRTANRIAQRGQLPAEQGLARAAGGPAAWGNPTVESQWGPLFEALSNQEENTGKRIRVDVGDLNLPEGGELPTAGKPPIRGNSSLKGLKAAVRKKPTGGY